MCSGQAAAKGSKEGLSTTAFSHDTHGMLVIVPGGFLSRKTQQTYNWLLR